MKNSILIVLISTLVFILSGCGSNDKIDGNIGGTTVVGNVTATLQSIVIDKATGDIIANVNLTSMYDNPVVVTLDGMNVALGGCLLDSSSVSISPDTVTLDAIEPSKEIILRGTLADSSCIPTSYQVSGTNTIVKDGETTIEAFTTPMIDIALLDIAFVDASAFVLEVIDKQVSSNVSGEEKIIRVHLSQGSIGSKDRNIVMSSTVTNGSFLSSTTKTDDAGDVIFTYVAPTPMVDSNFTVQFCLEEDTTICDVANITLTTGEIVLPVDPIDEINYFITFTPEGGVYNMSIDSRNNALVSLIDKDTGLSIPDNRIKSIYVKSKDTSVLKLTPEGGGTPEASVIFGTGRNDVFVLMSSDKQNSGLAPIEIVIEYYNLNGILQTRGQLFSMAVLSGAPTAFSINDNGVSYNFDTKQFEHKFLIQSTDASGNPISTTGVINVSAMASFAKDSTGREMLYGRHANQDDGISATLTPNNDKATLELSGLAPFNSNDIKLNRAFVAVFGDVETYEANGKWNIESIASTNTLNLNNMYYGDMYAELGMAIGYNYRDKFCTSAYEESVVVVDSTDGTYQLDDEGKAVVTLKHDAYMIGKRAMVLVNMTGLNPNTGEIQRSGEVHSVTLSSSFGMKGASTSVPKGATNFFVMIEGMIDTGTTDVFPLINSTFGCGIEFSNANYATTPEVIFRNDPASCDAMGHAFMYFYVNGDPEKDGSVTFTDCKQSFLPNY